MPCVHLVKNNETTKESHIYHEITIECVYRKIFESKTNLAVMFLNM